MYLKYPGTYQYKCTMFGNQSDKNREFTEYNQLIRLGFDKFTFAHLF